MNEEALAHWGGVGGNVALKANKTNKYSVSKYRNKLPIRYRITSYPIFLGLACVQIFLER